MRVGDQPDNDNHRWPCTPYCSPSVPCAAECELPEPPPPDIDPQVAELALDLSVKLQSALGEQCHGHLRLPSGGGLRCRRIVGHPSDRGLNAGVAPELHAYGGPDDVIGGELRTWADGDMGTTTHREYWALYGQGEMRRHKLKGTP